MIARHPTTRRPQYEPTRQQLHLVRRWARFYRDTQHVSTYWYLNQLQCEHQLRQAGFTDAVAQVITARLCKYNYQ